MKHSRWDRVHTWKKVDLQWEILGDYKSGSIWLLIQTLVEYDMSEYLLETNFLDSASVLVELSNNY